MVAPLSVLLVEMVVPHTLVEMVALHLYERWADDSVDEWSNRGSPTGRVGGPKELPHVWW